MSFPEGVDAAAAEVIRQFVDASILASGRPRAGDFASLLPRWSQLTNGYRRQRRKHGRKGWPSRKARLLSYLLTLHSNWQLRKAGLIRPGEADAVRVVPR